jgi:hypothetical protein
MGLDVILYTGCKREETGVERKDDTFVAYNVDTCSENVKEPGLYSYEDRRRMWSAPCTTYNEMRAELCRRILDKTPVDIWMDPIPCPFLELINFPDNEGSFDTETCQKLAKDFAEYESKALDDCTVYFEHFYTSLRTAFQTAADNFGMVQYT